MIPIIQKNIVDTPYGLDTDIFTILWKQCDYRFHDISPIDILTPALDLEK